MSTNYSVIGARLLVALLAAVTCSCDYCGERSESDSGESSERDVSTNDLSDIDREGDSQETTEREFPRWLFNQARSDAYCENSKGQRISYPSPTLDFTKPSPVPLAPFVKGREELLESAPGDRSGRTISSSGVDSDLRPRANGAYSLFAEEGRDVTLFTSALIDDQNVEGAILTSNVYLGYTPIEAKFELMNPEFESVVASKRTNNFRIRYSSVAEAVPDNEKMVNKDGTFIGIRVTIPAGAIPYDGFHELGWHVTLAGPSNHLFSKTKKFALYRAGYERESHDCLVRFEASQPTNSENLAFSKQLNFFYGISLWPEGKADGSQGDVLGPHAAKPGERVTLKWAAEAENTDSNTDSASAALPTLNGLPIADPVFFVESGQDSSRREDYRTTASGDFTLTLPEESGVYDVRIVEFPDPYRIIKNLDGERFDSVSADSMSVKQGSPVVRYIVD